MRVALVIAACLFALLLASPVSAQEAVIAFACSERGHAEALAGEMTDHSVQQRDPS